MPAAAALLERILNEGYASGMLRAANPVTAELDPRMLVKTVAPRRFAMPRPVKPKGHYSKILEWEEEEERVASPNHRGYEQSKYEYLRHGGAYVERVLAQSRAIALLLKIAGGGCSSDEAPQWPPAPSSVPASKQAVPSASPDLEQEQEQESGEISRWTPSPSGEVPAGFFIGRDGLEWPLPPRECMGSPIEDFLRVVRPGLQWSKTSRLTDASPSIEGTVNAPPDREPSPGYFIGRDGIKWPIPPRECMSSTAWNLVNVSRPPPHHTTAPDPAPVSATSRNYDASQGKARPGYFIGRGGLEWPLPPPECVDPAILEIYRNHSRVTHPSRPQARPGFFVGRGGLKWPLPPAECIDPAVLEAHRDTPAPTHSPVTGESRSAGEDAHDSPASMSTSSSTDSTNSMLPVTPQCRPLELTDWRGLHIATIGDSSPATTRAKLADPGRPLHENLPPSLPVRIRGLGDAYASSGSSWTPVVEGGFFRGRDGTWWPLPPTDEELDEEKDVEEEKERRGRSPTPKWSMLRV